MFKVNRKELKDNLEVIKILAGNGHMIQNCVLLEMKDNKLSLHATNLSTTLLLPIDHAEGEDISFVLDSKGLLDIVNSLEGKTITFKKKEEDKVIISDNEYEFSTNTVWDINDYPIIEPAKEYHIIVNFKDFLSCLSLVKHNMDKTDSFYHFSNVFVDTKYGQGKIGIAASNGKTLSVTEIEYNQFTTSPDPFFVDKETVKIFEILNKKFKFSYVTIFINDHKVDILLDKNFLVRIHKYDQRFPNYKLITENVSESIMTVMFKTDITKKKVKKLASIAKKYEKPILTMSLENQDSLILFLKLNEENNVKTNLKVNSFEKNSGTKVSIPVDHFKNFIDSCDKDYFNMEVPTDIESGTKPIIFFPVESKYNFKEYIMPIIIEE